MGATGCRCPCWLKLSNMDTPKEKLAEAIIQIAKTTPAGGGDSPECALASAMSLAASLTPQQKQQLEILFVESMSLGAERLQLAPLFAAISNAAEIANVIQFVSSVKAAIRTDLN